jgi:hypothetical protein
MSTIVTMTATVGNYVNGQTYRVRSRNAEQFVATSKATKLPQRKITSGNPGSSEGK